MRKNEQEQIDWNERKKDWLRRIDEFYQIVQEYLKEYLNQGKAGIHFSPLTLNEEYIGNYETKRLHLMTGNQEVIFFSCRNAHDRFQRESACKISGLH